jgi:hypothetical protein
MVCSHLLWNRSVGFTSGVLGFNSPHLNLMNFLSFFFSPCKFFRSWPYFYLLLSCTFSGDFMAIKSSMLLHIESNPNYMYPPHLRTKSHLKLAAMQEIRCGVWYATSFFGTKVSDSVLVFRGSPPHIWIWKSLCLLPIFFLRLRL